jgi:arsenite methyltransferase
MIRPESSRLIARPWPLPTRASPPPTVHASTAAASTDHLFERTAGLYAFFREHLFRDDTERIVSALWPGGGPSPGTLMLEVGCGPGVYARRLAGRCRGLRTVGVDRSWRLLDLAWERAARERITGCRFEHGDALALDWPDASVDAVVASRLFTVVDGAAALVEMHRVLRPGGRCFIAEPASAMATLATMLALRLADWLAAPLAAQAANASVPRWPTCLSAGAFSRLMGSQPWSDLHVTQERGYRYAVGVKIRGELTR